MKRRVRAAAVALLVVTLAAGCATTGGGAEPGAGATAGVSGGGGRLGNPADPWETWNRRIFAFNEKLDEAVLKPVATAYVDHVPGVVRTGIGNLFNHFADAWSMVNNFLQGKLAAGLQDMVRVAVNTVFGVFGLIDMAGEAGIDHQYEDLGQTLGRWGFGPGPYVVWPLFGPSTLRDSFALPIDKAATPALFFDDAARLSINAMNIVDARSRLLGAGRLLDDIALDKYQFIRDGYLQRRRSLVRDGAEEPEDRGEDDAGGAGADAAPPSDTPAASRAASAPADGASAPRK